MEAGPAPFEHYGALQNGGSASRHAPYLTKPFDMPVKSLNSSVLVWPDRNRVDHAVRHWAAEQSRQRPMLRRLGYFGSYARGDWGIGSDLDVIAVVAEAAEPFDRRALAWELTTLPVPAEILVYTEGEWQALVNRGGRFARTLEREVVWM